MNLLAMLEIITCWLIIWKIAEYMVSDGLVKEVRNLIQDIRRGLL